MAVYHSLFAILVIESTMKLFQMLQKFYQYIGIYPPLQNNNSLSKRNSAFLFGMFVLLLLYSWSISNIQWIINNPAITNFCCFGNVNDRYARRFDMYLEDANHFEFNRGSGAISDGLLQFFNDDFYAFQFKSLSYTQHSPVVEQMSKSNGAVIPCTWIILSFRCVSLVKWPAIDLLCSTMRWINAIGICFR